MGCTSKEELRRKLEALREELIRRRQHEELMKKRRNITPQNSFYVKLCSTL